MGPLFPTLLQSLNCGNGSVGRSPPTTVLTRLRHYPLSMPLPVSLPILLSLTTIGPFSFQFIDQVAGWDNYGSGLGKVKDTDEGKGIILGS